MPLANKAIQSTAEFFTKNGARIGKSALVGAGVGAGGALLSGGNVVRGGLLGAAGGATFGGITGSMGGLEGIKGAYSSSMKRNRARLANKGLTSGQMSLF